MNKSWIMVLGCSLFLGLLTGCVTVRGTTVAYEPLVLAKGQEVHISEVKSYRKIFYDLTVTKECTPGGCGGKRCEYVTFAQFRCPEGQVKQILFIEAQPKAVLCRSRYQSE